VRNPDLHLSPNRANVAAKVIDGEAIILDITRGAYYSTDGSGAVIWAALEQGHPLGAILGMLEARYDGDRREIEQHLERLTEELLSEGLVISSNGHSPGAEEASGESGTPRQPFTPPTLHKYTEMGDLLALDPPLPALDDSSADT
jgi:hypothetical protein